ncbi:hypothetical protein RUMCAL_02212 [Ruminococcus callidus ATCC 27760]|uniref:Uncharacterized protein n=1 Tax=Ruminococcus callidus ATCC 27760 TaxID=411473 RepID=U2LW75_9FIRM|nr:hypothetical protein RUMCAL_02212 [Ruminococcus callidus ATCC 27760]
MSRFFPTFLHNFTKEADLPAERSAPYPFLLFFSEETLQADACKFPVIFHKNAREYITVFTSLFVSSDGKFDDASVTQSLCGIALIT